MEIDKQKNTTTDLEEKPLFYHINILFCFRNFNDGCLRSAANHLAIVPSGWLRALHKLSRLTLVNAHFIIRYIILEVKFNMFLILIIQGRQVYYRLDTPNKPARTNGILIGGIQEEHSIISEHKCVD